MASPNNHRNHPPRPATQAGGAGGARPPPPPPAPQHHGGGGRGHPLNRPANGPQQGEFKDNHFTRLEYAAELHPFVQALAASRQVAAALQQQAALLPAAPRPASAERRSTDRPLRSNFIDDPWVTFYKDEARVVCDICSETELALNRPRTTVVDETPAILPCGHVFGLECLNTWLEIHSTCPSCRLELRHPKCGHKLGAGAITTNNVARIPKIIPHGGFITETCLDCARSASEKEAERLAGPLTRYLRTVLSQHRASLGDESYAEMVEMAEKHIGMAAEEVIQKTRIDEWWNCRRVWEFEEQMRYLEKPRSPEWWN